MQNKQNKHHGPYTTGSRVMDERIGRSANHPLAKEPEKVVESRFVNNIGGYFDLLNLSKCRGGQAGA